MPADWEGRLTPLTNENTGGATGWCLEPHDLAISKLAARREKDIAFVAALLRFKMVRQTRLQSLIQTFEDAPLREKLAEGLELCSQG